MEAGGGGAAACSTAACACAQGGMATVRSWRCLGITSIRMPGVCMAIETGSCCAACFLLPQPVAPTAVAATPIAIPQRARDLMRAPPLVPTALSIGFPVGYPRYLRGNDVVSG